MALPQDWKAEFRQNAFDSASFVCPHCGLPSTFRVQAVTQELRENKFTYYVTLKCNYIPCQQNVFVITTRPAHMQGQDHTDSVTIFPSRAIPESHKAIPPAVSEDWVEAQKAFEVGAVKAAAVMCRRVLYGVLLDKKCREHPLQEGINELVNLARLPQVVEHWLQEIKEEGHDAAHPYRALIVPAENVSETMGYTKELLRFVYIEPFELEQRLARKAQQAKTP